MSNEFKLGIDRGIWCPVGSNINAHTVGHAICADMRSDKSRSPLIFNLASNILLNRYNVITKSWSFVVSPALGGTFGAGACAVFAPSQGLNGSISSGCTTTVITTKTTMTAVGVNMLANRGGSGERGYKVRIIGLVAGKTEERWISANTGGTTPTLVLDTPLTFTPSDDDQYEILSGRVFMLGAGTLSATSFKSFEIGANTLASGANTGLPATIGTDSDFVALDEQYSPYDCEPGEGFIKGSYLYDSCEVSDRYALSATAAGASSITGQATGGDFHVVENEYRNFQIRIVQDTVNPTATGQRRIIASHTAGASPVYTLGSAWSVTPSTSAKYVIEYPNLLLLRSTATNVVYTFNYNDFSITNGTNTINAGAWSTTYFSVAPAVAAVGGMWMPAYGIRPEAQKYSRHSHIFWKRGGATLTIDLLDIARSITGGWEAAIVYDGGVSTTTGSCGAYAPYENEGRFFYLNDYFTSRACQMQRFDVQNRVMSPMTPTQFIQSGTAVVGKRMASYCVFDGTDKYSIVFLQSHLSTICQELLILY